MRYMCGQQEAQRTRIFEKALDTVATSPFARPVSGWVLAGVGGGARVAALAAAKCRWTVCGYVLLSYPLMVGGGGGAVGGVARVADVRVWVHVCARACVCACVRACVRSPASLPACLPACVCLSVSASVSVCLCLCLCLYLCLCACVCLSLCLCVCVCVCACVCLRVCEPMPSSPKT